jgi:hypothetical protein
MTLYINHLPFMHKEGRDYSPVEISEVRSRSDQGEMISVFYIIGRNEKGLLVGRDRNPSNGEVRNPHTINLKDIVEYNPIVPFGGL